MITKAHEGKSTLRILGYWLTLFHSPLTYMVSHLLLKLLINIFMILPWPKVIFKKRDTSIAHQNISFKGSLYMLLF